MKSRPLGLAATVSVAGHAIVVGGLVLLGDGGPVPPPPVAAPLIVDIALAPPSAPPPAPPAVPQSVPASPGPAVPVARPATPATEPVPPAPPLKPLVREPPADGGMASAAPAPASPSASTSSSVPGPATGDAIEPPRYTLGSAWCPAPEYPERARLRGHQGSVTLSVTVDETGRVGALAIVEGSGHALLDQAALNTIRSWRFAPATRNGIPVAATRTVVIRFALGGSVRTASGPDDRVRSIAGKAPTMR